LAQQGAELHEVKYHVSYLDEQEYNSWGLPGRMALWDIRYLGLTERTKDRTWKAVSRCKVATDIVDEEWR
jgi:hypothetical protein